MTYKFMRFQLKKEGRVLIPFGLSSLVLALLAKWIGSGSIGFFGLIYRFCLLASLILALVTMVIAFYRTWMDFYHAFYSPRAYLTRTLPLSRTSIFTGVLLDGFLYEILALVIILLDAWILAGSDLFVIIEPYKRLIGYFLVTIFCQTITIQCCGYTGIYLGFKRPLNKWGFSILFGFLLYYVLEFAMIGFLFGGLALLGYTNYDSYGILETERLFQLMFFLYILVVAALIFYLHHSIKKGMDTDQ